MVDTDDLLKDLLQTIDQSTQKKRSLDDVIQAHSVISREQVRWKVARLIIGAYVIIIVISVLYLMIRSFITGVDEFPNMIELVKIAVIPVVTFVLGYYYGTSSK